MKLRCARIAVRSDVSKDGHCLVLGITNPEVFKPGKVYEVIEIDGEHIIKELGDSAATAGVAGYVTWSQDANTLVETGMHLLTIEEYRAKCQLRLSDRMNEETPSEQRVLVKRAEEVGVLIFSEVKDG